jgi:hypothetical protein
LVDEADRADFEARLALYPPGDEGELPQRFPSQSVAWIADGR